MIRIPFIMVVFFVTFMPLFYWALQGLFDHKEVRVRDILLPYAGGLVFAVPAILFYWAMDVYFKLAWNPIGLYMHTLLNKEGFLYLPAILLIVLVYWKKPGGTQYFREIAGFFCGYYSLIALIDVVSDHVYTSYDMLLLPLVRLTTLCIASLLISRMLTARGKKKTGLTAGLFLLPLILNVFPLLYLLNQTILLYILFVPTTLAALILSYLDLQEKLP